MVAFVHEQPRRDWHGTDYDSTKGDRSEPASGEKQVRQSMVRLADQYATAGTGYDERQRCEREPDHGVRQAPHEAEKGQVPCAAAHS